MTLAERNAIFRVTGGIPLSGEITPQGNKNDALPLLAAACLTDQPVILENLPAIEDVAVMEEILRTLGITVEISDDRTMATVCARTNPSSDSISKLAKKNRSCMIRAQPP